jgi:hypothetical protein
MTQKGDSLLSIKNLSTHFYTEQGLVKAVQDVSFLWARRWPWWAKAAAARVLRHCQ